MVQVSEDHDGYKLSAIRTAASEVDILADAQVAQDLWPFGAPDSAGALVDAAASAAINLLALAHAAIVGIFAIRR